MKEIPSAADEQDRVLVQRYLGGQREAATALVDRYQKRLFNVALRLLGDVQDAEDVTQTVFLNAFAKLRTYDPKYRFFSWVYRMTVNASLNALKRRRHTVTLEDLPIAVPEAGADSATEARDRVKKALTGLRPEDRTLLVLRHLESLSYEEMADVLEIPVKTVKSRLFTARERLRTTLNAQVH